MFEEARKSASADGEAIWVGNRSLLMVSSGEAGRIAEVMDMLHSMHLESLPTWEESQYLVSRVSTFISIALRTYLRSASGGEIY